MMMTRSSASASSTTRSPGCSATTSTTSSGSHPGCWSGPTPTSTRCGGSRPASAEDETVTAELCCTIADGAPVRVEATYRVVATGSGATWYLASYRDLSDRVEAAAALRRSEAWAEAMVQGSSDLVMVADPEGVVRYASPAITEVLGYHARRLRGPVFAERDPPGGPANRSPGLFEVGAPAHLRGKGYEFRVVASRRRLADG